MFNMHIRRLALTLQLALAAAVAQAQWSPAPTMDLDLGLGTTSIGIDPSVLSASRPAPATTRGAIAARVSTPVSPKLKAYCTNHPTDGQCRRTARPPAAPHARNLVFKPSATVSQKVERDIVNDLARRNRDLWRPQLETNLRLANYKAQFDTLLRLYGRSPTNLGDVMGVYLVMAWESYGGGVASPTEIVAVSRQWRRELRRSALATRPDAQKQALAETLAWRAMLAAVATRTARAQAAPLVALREGLRAEVRQVTGIDLARQHFTERGFEPD